MQVAATLGSIEELASSRQSEVIGKAFAMASIKCNNCNYPQHATEFEGDLTRYEWEKMELHRTNVRLKVHHRTSYHSCCQGRCQTCIKLNTAWLEQVKVCRFYRRYLKEHWPCAECIERYNPTRRRKHPPTSFPQEKGFLDD